MFTQNVRPLRPFLLGKLSLDGITHTQRFIQRWWPDPVYTLRVHRDPRQAEGFFSRETSLGVWETSRRMFDLAEDSLGLQGRIPWHPGMFPARSIPQPDRDPGAPCVYTGSFRDYFLQCISIISSISHTSSISNISSISRANFVSKGKYPKIQRKIGHKFVLAIASYRTNLSIKFLDR